MKEFLMIFGFTGATGFIGSYLARWFGGKRIAKIRVLVRSSSIGLKQFDPEVSVVPGDLLSPADCAEFLKGVNVLFHLAHVNSPVTSDRDMTSDARANLIPLLNLLQTIQDSGSKTHVIYFSSGGAVYGRRPSHIPWKENDACFPVSSYGIQKLAAEHYLRLAAGKGILTVSVLRPGNVYGTLLPGQRLQGLIGVTLNNVLQGKPAMIFGSNSNTRDYVHLEDVASFCEQVVIPRESFSLFNVGSQIGHTVEQVLTTIERQLGRPLERQYKQVGQEDFLLPEWVVLDNSKAHSELDWRPKVSLETGIGKMLEGVR